MNNAINIESDYLPHRMRAAISFAWSLFARKVGGGVIEVNKEASMQLQFSYILQQLLPLIAFHKSEVFALELETGVRLENGSCEIDVLFKGKAGEQEHRIAIEMKCYKTLASSGNPRGATDIFMKDVYEDLAILEQYVGGGHAQEGLALVMTDMRRLVQPTRKDAKCWDYDISDGASFGPIQLSTPIGGKPINITLKNQYLLDWIQYGDFWFLEAQGRSVEENTGSHSPEKAEVY
ncbi:hypothetical protein [Herbaspirillum frisingense]|uniref:hypothetical protein n=1 Tax=Herbaspirillum frisingense TaxID=92645 RepID=UPI001F167E57|nr:hypothetical protein [Herbaspirillum frisingense]UIN20698.1 hypothetical protein LAZ82_19845 [Herbaspirillum frisingense]